MRILLLEDDPFWAKHVRSSLSDHFPDVEIQHYQRAADVTRVSASEPFDCLILDRLVEDGDSLNALAELRRIGIETPAVILSSLNEIEHRAQGLDTGADDYLGKDFQPVELAARVRAAVRRGKSQGHPRILQLDELSLHRTARKADWKGRTLKLTPKEFDVLLTIAENGDLITTPRELWAAAWPHMSKVNPQTRVIHTTVSRLRGKVSETDFEIAYRDDGYILQPISTVDAR